MEQVLGEHSQPADAVIRQNFCSHFNITPIGHPLDQCSLHLALAPAFWTCPEDVLDRESAYIRARRTRQLPSWSTFFGH
uniref:Transposase n=1 Tax=Ascaris lumbricoides TaxID=6252 RepID=A0A0M3HT38_ASCLU